jgi:hypothetical protein
MNDLLHKIDPQLVGWMNEFYENNTCLEEILNYFSAKHVKFISFDSLLKIDTLVFTGFEKTIQIERKAKIPK